MRGLWFLCRAVACRLNCAQEVIEVIRVNVSALIVVVKGWEQ